MGGRQVNPPERWDIVLLDGSVVSVWADSAEGLAGEEDTRDYRFCNLMDVPVDAQGDFDILGTTPSNVERVIVTVAHFPRSAVAEVR